MRFRIFLTAALVTVTLFGSSTAFCGTFENYKEAGDRCLRAGQMNSAVTEYQNALTLNPCSTAVLFNLSIAHYQSKNFKAAASALEKIVKLTPSDYEACYNLACLKLHQNDLPEARRYLEQAKSCCHLDPEFTPLIKNTLEFVGKLDTLDPQTRGILLPRLLAQHHAAN